MTVLVVAIFSSVNESAFSKLKSLIYTSAIVSEFNLIEKNTTKLRTACKKEKERLFL